MCFESYYCLLQTNKCNNPNTNKCKQKNVYIFYLFLFIVKKKNVKESMWVVADWTKWFCILESFLMQFMKNAFGVQKLFSSSVWKYFSFFYHIIWKKVFVSVVCSRYCFNWSFILLLQAVMIPSSSGETTKHFTLVNPRYRAVIRPMFDRVR